MVALACLRAAGSLGAPAVAECRLSAWPIRAAGPLAAPAVGVTMFNVSGDTGRPAGRKKAIR